MAITCVTLTVGKKPRAVLGERVQVGASWEADPPLVFAGVLCGRPGPGGAHGLPVAHVHRRGGPRQRGDHLHLQAFGGGPGPRDVRKHPHR